MLYLFIDICLAGMLVTQHFIYRHLSDEFYELKNRAEIHMAGLTVMSETPEKSPGI